MSDRGPLLDSELALMLVDSDQEVARLRGKLEALRATISELRARKVCLAYPDGSCDGKTCTRCVLTRALNGEDK